MHTITKDRYIPSGSTAHKFHGVEAVVYTSVRSDGQPYAIGYSGKRNNHDFNFRFRTQESMAIYIANWVANLRGCNGSASRTQSRQGSTEIPRESV